MGVSERPRYWAPAMFPLSVGDRVLCRKRDGKKYRWPGTVEKVNDTGIKRCPHRKEGKRCPLRPRCQHDGTIDVKFDDGIYQRKLHMNWATHKTDATDGWVSERDNYGHLSLQFSEIPSTGKWKQLLRHDNTELLEASSHQKPFNKKMVKIPSFLQDSQKDSG